MSQEHYSRMVHVQGLWTFIGPVEEMNPALRYLLENHISWNSVGTKHLAIVPTRLVRAAEIAIYDGVVKKHRWWAAEKERDERPATTANEQLQAAREPDLNEKGSTSALRTAAEVRAEAMMSYAAGLIHATIKDRFVESPEWLPVTLGGPRPGSSSGGCWGMRTTVAGQPVIISVEADPGE